MVVSFHALANLEMNEAAQYYESESAGLGRAFIAEVERCADDIVRYPEAGVVVRTAIRRRLIRRFPYALLYRAKPAEVRILAGDEPETSPYLLGGSLLHE